MKLKSIKTDLIAATAGIWVRDIPGMEDLALLVRPLGNPDYRSRYAELAASAPRDAKRGGIIVDAGLKADISAEAMSQTVLLDWSGMEDDDGKPLPFSAEQAKAILLDPEYIKFRDAVSWAANVAEEETTGDRKAKAKN